MGLGLKSNGLPDRIHQLMLHGKHPTDHTSRDQSRNLFACVGEMIVARISAERTLVDAGRRHTGRWQGALLRVPALPPSLRNDDRARG